MEHLQEKRILERAVHRGLVAPEAAEQALRRQRELASRGERKSLFQILVANGEIRREDLAAIDDRSLERRALGGFDVVEKIGEGGMGAVYRATQRSLGRVVALKVLAPDLAARPEVAERFRREARAAARLDHPNVVQPIDFGESDGLLFFAMELMEGGSASERLDEGGPFPERHALEVVLAVARALAYARTLGLVHRDVKPDNILFSKHGTPKLADLGLVFERATPGLTEHGIAMGTPHYMSPEQALGQRDLDSRSDIYSLGVTLWELLSGRRPFDRGNPAEILAAHVSQAVPDVRTVAPHVSEATATLVARMTAKRREDRFQTPEELATAIERLLKRLGPTSGEVPIRRDDAAGTATAPLPHAGPPAASRAPPSARRRGALLGAIAILAALAAFVGLSWQKRRHEPAVDAAAEARAATDLRALLLGRRGKDGGFSYAADAGSDPWTTAQALAAFSVAPDGVPTECLHALVRSLHERPLRGPAGEPDAGRGWPVVTAGEAWACIEASAWVGIGLSLAGDRYGATAAADAAAARRFLLAQQLADGSFPSVAGGGSRATRTSATGLALVSLVALEGGKPTPEGARAVAKAAQWLGVTYDRDGRTWYPNTAASWGNRRRVPGLSEHCAWALLEAETFLARAGEPLPAEALAAVESFAAARPEADLPLETLGSSAAEDYVFEVGARRATMTEVRWVYGCWRLLAAERIAARTPPLPGAAEWRAEARRLRSRLPALDRALLAAQTFQVAECLFAVNLIRARGPDDPARASLAAWLAQGGK